jgi:hypothetical protein
MRIGKEFDLIVPPLTKKTTHGLLNRGIQIRNSMKYFLTKNMPSYHQKLVQNSRKAQNLFKKKTFEPKKKADFV